MMISQEIVTIDRWHHCLNNGDLEGLMALIHPDVEVGGPRGVGRGSQLFRDWVARAGVQLTPTRYFQSEGVIVVEEEAVWRAPDSDQPAGSRRVFSLFTVSAGLITRILRFDALATALEAAGMDESHEVTSR